MGIKKDVFGKPLFLKKLAVRVVGLMSYARLNWHNKTEVTGSEILNNLPDRNVIIISNHQTYFADVMAMIHVIHATLNGKPNTTRYPGFLKKLKHNINFVAAVETMKAGWLPKFMSMAGAIEVSRTWRKDGENIKRKVDKNDVSSINKALDNGWVISFPQGTTKPYAPGRKGTAYILKEHQPIIIPVKIDGFRRAFDKKGLFLKKKKSTLKVNFQNALEIDYDESIDEIMNIIMDSIGQSEKHELSFS